MELKPGTRLGSGVSTTEVIVVRAPNGDVDLRCGGYPMRLSVRIALDGAADPKHTGGTQLGKRYVDEEMGIEVLCSKAGEGSLSIGDKPLLPKEAKPLPSSD